MKVQEVAEPVWMWRSGTRGCRKRRMCTGNLASMRVELVSGYRFEWGARFRIVQQAFESLYLLVNDLQDSRRLSVF